jgi:hypothetical protein
MKTAYILKNRKQVHYVMILISIICSLILISCYPGDAISPSNADIITTFKKSTADFSSIMSYAMPDSVIYISNDGPEASKYPLQDQQILTAIKRNMLQYGYSKEEDPAQADVLVVALITSTKWVAGGCYSWYWSYWYPYWGYCYPVSYSYETGTIFIIMVDPELGDGSAENAEWVAAMNGLLSSVSNAEARIDRNIDQAFYQSPYLGGGK